MALKLPPSRRRLRSSANHRTTRSSSDGSRSYSTLSRTITSTTGSYAPTLGRNSAAAPPEKAAERVAQEIAQQREAELVVHLPDEKNEPNAFCKKLGRQIVPAMIRRNRATRCYTFTPSRGSRVQAGSRGG